MCHFWCSEPPVAGSAILCPMHCKQSVLGVGSDELHPCLLPNPIFREAGTISEDTGPGHLREEDAHMSPDNKSIVRRLYQEVWNKRKLEIMSELLSPSHALHGPLYTGPAIGPEVYKGQVAIFVAGFPDLRFEIEDTVAEADKVVVCWTFSGTHRGEFMGVPATSKRVSVDGITIHVLSKGIIMDSYVSLDMWGMMQQLGVITAPGGPKSAAAR